MKIKIPCSTSNLGPGFDTLGLALNRYLFLLVTQSDLPAGSTAGVKSPVKISVEGNGKEHIADDESNLVMCGMNAAAKKFGKNLPAFHLHLKNEIPAYGGLGGSGAAIAGGIFLANELLNGNLSREEMLNIAVEIEGHPDNVSAALFGGLTINCYDADRIVHCRSVKIEKPLTVITCSPHFQVQTKHARKLLPDQIPLYDAVTNIENASSLVAALMSGDFDAIRYATNDRLHEQYRATLIPGYDAVKKAALDAGALSFNISGAGPTVFAFAVEYEQEIAEAMVNAFEKNGQKSTAEIMNVENAGVERLV
jgi:homoserine kinase